MEDPLRAGSTDPELRLIETLRWDGLVLVRQSLHLARLSQSAARLGWPCDVREAARMLGLATWAAPARLRLTLNKSGAFHVTTTPLPTTQAVWRLGMARQCLFSDDPWLQVKSSRRTAYDTARADIDAGLDEVILLNERAEVCDGTITTLFFDRGAGLRTPPLTSGLLPGVLRGQMLAEGACAEEVLSADDLPVVRLWVGNSLRGLAPAVWQG